MKSKHLKMLSLLMVIGFFLMPSALAHGPASQNAEELMDHIQSHISELESLMQNPTADVLWVRDEFREILFHARQYQNLARKWIRSDQDVLTAKTLEMISRYLMEAAARQDLATSLKLLKHIEILIQPAA